MADAHSDETTPRLAFWIGALSGLDLAAGLVLVWFGFRFSATGATLRNFGGQLSALTRLVTHPIYLVVIPAAVIAAVVLANISIKRPTVRLAVVGGLAVIAAAAIVFGYWGAVHPFVQLAGDIK